jgi:hypothetical protein
MIANHTTKRSIATGRLPPVPHATNYLDLETIFCYAIDKEKGSS